MSAQPIYSKAGWPVGWLLADVIYDSTGEARAFVTDGSICSYEGQRFGSYGGGYLRDPSGDAVGYVEGAEGGPPLPEIKASEAPPELKDEPVRPSMSGAVSEPRETGQWSELAFNTLLRGWPPGVIDLTR